MTAPPATTATEDRINEIDTVQWQRDKHNTLNLFVTDKDGRPLHAWLTLRPPYCDRGHIQLNIDGYLALDEMDSFPRYFFTFEEADRHCRTFLKWRLWEVRGISHDALCRKWAQF